MNDFIQKLKASLGRFSGNSDLGFVFGLFGAVLLLVVPVHKDILSILLVISIAISLLILLTVIYVKDPPEFSVFPTLLLSVTLYRLGLNVASTRLILLDGDAGSVIESFGTFVVGGNYVVGTVIFLILVIINFVVISVPHPKTNFLVKKVFLKLPLEQFTNTPCLCFLILSTK